MPKDREVLKVLDSANLQLRAVKRKIDLQKLNGWDTSCHGKASPQ